MGGNSFAGMRLAARNSLHGYISETTQGVSYYEAVKAMLAQAKDDWPTLLARLEKLRDTLLSQDGIIINLTADQTALDAIRPVVDEFVSRLPATPKVQPGAPAWADAVTLPTRKDEGFAITTQVNYVAAGTQLFEAGEKTDGAYYAVARFLSRGYLWDNVRVVGGAYGGGFAFTSYRDPNLLGTLDIYAGAVGVLENLMIDDAALEQCIVGAAGDLDSPMTSQQIGFRALTHHLTGVTTEMRQQYRDEVIGTTRDSFAAFAAKLKGVKTYTAIFGSKTALEEANAKRGPEEQISITQLG